MYPVTVCHQPCIVKLREVVHPFTAKRTVGVITHADYRSYVLYKEHTVLILTEELD